MMEATLMNLDRHQETGTLSQEKDNDQAVSSTVAPDVLREIVRRIVDVAHPERVILFGSAARGEMQADSDVDVLVVKSGLVKMQM